jgi:hypothetical protein
MSWRTSGFWFLVGFALEPDFFCGAISLDFTDFFGTTRE